MRLASFADWTPFRSSVELMRIVSLDFVRILNNPKNRYGLSVTELELLNYRAAEIRASSPATANRPGGVEPGGAEGGGVLLDIGHKDPSEGALLEDG